MATIKITVGNSFLHNISEDFLCRDVDISDEDEIEYCAYECCGQYLEMHADAIHALCPDLDSETIEEACYFIVEEIIEE